MNEKKQFNDDVEILDDIDSGNTSVKVPPVQPTFVAENGIIHMASPTPVAEPTVASNPSDPIPAIGSSDEIEEIIDIDPVTESKPEKEKMNKSTRNTLLFLVMLLLFMILFIFFLPQLSNLFA